MIGFLSHPGSPSGVALSCEEGPTPPSHHQPGWWDTWSTTPPCVHLCACAPAHVCVTCLRRVSNKTNINNTTTTNDYSHSNSNTDNTMNDTSLHTVRRYDSDYMNLQRWCTSGVACYPDTSTDVTKHFSECEDWSENHLYTTSGAGLQLLLPGRRAKARVKGVLLSKTPV